MARQAVAMLKKSKTKMSTRKAADVVNEKHCAYGITISHMSVQNYKEENYDPQSCGKASYLPAEFNEHLAKWILAMRALKQPIFKDTVIASANNALRDTTYSQKFNHKELVNDWYYRFLKSYNHIFDTGNQRPIEVARAKWATSKNIGEWYDMLAQVLVDLKVAVNNPSYNPDAPLGTPSGAEQVHITDPDRIISFDESRIELDMTQSSKANEERTLVEKHAPQAVRNERRLPTKGACAVQV